MTKYIITKPTASPLFRIYINLPFSGFEINKKTYNTTKEALLDLIQITEGARCKIIVK